MSGAVVNKHIISHISQCESCFKHLYKGDIMYLVIGSSDESRFMRIGVCCLGLFVRKYPWFDNGRAI